MSGLVESLLVFAAIAIVLFGIKDILSNIIHSVTYSNKKYMYGLNRRKRVRYRSSARKTKPTAAPVQSLNQAEEEDTEVINLFEDVSIRYRPSTRKTEATTTPVQFSNQLDEKRLEDINIYEDIKVSSKPLATKIKPTATPIYSQQQLEEKSEEKIYLYEDAKVRPKPSTEKAKSIASPIQSVNQLEEKSEEDIYFYEDIKTRPKPSTEKAKSTATPIQSRNQLKEKSEEDIYLYEDVKVLSNLLTKKTESTATPVPFTNKLDRKINIEARSKPSIKKTKPTKDPIQFRSQPIELYKPDVEDLIRNFDFYDTYINPKGKGLLHRYSAIELYGDNIVIDERTNLIWQQNGSSEQLYFEDAKKWLEKLNQECYAGFQDWRFPTLEEAMSLMESEPKNDGLYIDPVFMKTQEVIWTCDFQKDESQKWIVSFRSGFCGLSTYYSFDYVRAVRQDEHIRGNLII